MCLHCKTVMSVNPVCMNDPRRWNWTLWKHSICIAVRTHTSGFPDFLISQLHVGWWTDDDEGLPLKLPTESNFLTNFFFMDRLITPSNSHINWLLFTPLLLSHLPPSGHEQACTSVYTKLGSFTPSMQPLHLSYYVLVLFLAKSANIANNLTNCFTF